MSYTIKAYMQDDSVLLEPLSFKREWFDKTLGKMAYVCMPLSSANPIGWGIAFQEDISFIWDGHPYDLPKHVKILSGEKYIRVQENGTLAIQPYFSLSTDQNITMLLNPVPNQFSDEWATISLTFSTGFYHDTITPAITILKPNKIITIKAGTPVAAMLPISLSALNNSKMELYDWDEKDFSVYNQDYSDALAASQYSTEFVNFYRRAFNHKNEKIGKHEVKKLNLTTVKMEKNV